MYRPDGIDEIALSALPVSHPTLQPMPNGHVLVVGARAQWRPDDPDRNALLFGPDGDVVASATFGDGIEHVFATTVGDVWVGYFDEGVYGNYGWGGPGPTPIGACGLIQFGVDLAPEWTFPSHVNERWGAISDCYALNVTDEATWACYYTDFPIVKMQESDISWWANAVGGARALVTDGARVALVGGYGSDHSRVEIASLHTDTAMTFASGRLCLPGGAEVPEGAQMFGRGPELHVVVGDVWYRISLDRLVSAATKRRSWWRKNESDGSPPR